MRVVIAEDEPLAAQRLSNELSRRSDVCVVELCRDGPSAQAAIARHKPDVVVFDITMPGLSGFQVLEHCALEDMPIPIFVSAFEQFALDAFRHNALDFLLKPIDSEALHASIDRARQRMKEVSAETLARELQAVVEQLRSERRPEGPHVTEFWVKAGRRNTRVGVEDIEYAEALKDYVTLQTATQSHLLRSTMTRMEALLPPHQFLRVHRSYIVNLDKVAALVSGEKGELTLEMMSGRIARVGRSHAAALADRLGRK
ncbi:MAG: LytTR family DNA-binding domain-containing protein [Pseudomonadota bacterium]